MIRTIAPQSSRHAQPALRHLNAYDPIATIESIYGYFGLPLSGTAADVMRTTRDAGAPGGGKAARAPDGATRAHNYALADYGLTAAQVDERFAGYLEDVGPGSHDGRR
jgi:hypothetical protein